MQFVIKLYCMMVHILCSCFLFIESCKKHGRKMWDIPLSQMNVLVSSQILALEK